MYLNQQKRTVTLNELSKTLGVSKNNLIKASNQLVKLNFISATRGRAGGLVVKDETGDLSLKDIIVRTEESFAIAACFSLQKCECNFLPKCLLMKSLSDALGAFLDSLAQKTLNDVTPRNIRGLANKRS